MSEVYCLQVDLGSPIAASDPYIHLDSFVAYAAGVESVGHDGLEAMEDGDDPTYFVDEMPFKRYTHDDQWVWATSAAGIATPDKETLSETERWSTTKWRKHFDDDPVHQIKETHINTSSGSFKSYNAALPYTAADTLTFFFEVAADAEPGRVIDLIERHVSGIGKKRSQGFGRINDMEIVPTAGNVESAIYHDGRILRSTPVKFASGIPTEVRMERRTTRPPYWHAKNQEMAFVPFSDIGTDMLECEVIEPHPA